MDTNKPLSTDQINNFIKIHPQWKFEDNKLKADFKLKDFVTAINKLNEVAKAAESMDHHPQITNIYDKLSFLLCTHSVGDKVTSKDLRLAKEILEIIK